MNAAPGFIFSYLSTSQEIGISDMTYIVSSGMLNLNSINQKTSMKIMMASIAVTPQCVSIN